MPGSIVACTLLRIIESTGRKANFNPFQPITAPNEVDMVHTISFSNIKSSLWGQIAYSVLTGVGGTLLIVLFLTGLMPIGAIVAHLPWILGFNGLTTGYTLMDRTRDKIRRRRTVGAGCGFLVGLLACTLLNLMAWYTVGITVIYGSELLFFTIIASATGGLGAILAIKYFSLSSVKS
jgi:hypothetical protein